MPKKVDLKLDGLFDLDVDDNSFIEVEPDETDVVESASTKPKGGK